MKARQMVLARHNAYRTPVVNWSDLEAGEPVEIFRHAQVVACGRVEEVSASGTVVWLIGDAAVAKRSFLKSDGFFVRRT
jgi:hypothetical protein